MTGRLHFRRPKVHFTEKSKNTILCIRIAIGLVHFHSEDYILSLSYSIDLKEDMICSVMDT